jgi:D-glycero-D-manno-heptose 1,7-bisphosphate phosphatase
MPLPPRQCAILAGDLRTTLRDIGGRPLLAWLMREALRWGIEEFLLLTVPLYDPVRSQLEALPAGLPRPVPIRISTAPAQAGTGGALHHARDRLDDGFLLLNGDSLLTTDLGPALAAFAHDDLGTVCRMVRRAGHSLGIYLMDRRVADSAVPEGSLDDEVIPRLINQGLVRETVAAGWLVPAFVRRPALLLDRDGVLNHDHGWVGSRARFEWMPGAIAAVRHATAAGYHVFVVTNQSGVARGLYTEEDVRDLHRWMGEVVRSAGGTIDDFRYCPFHPQGVVEKYRGESDWRKPAPGMLLDLTRAWELEPASCLMVGDQARDIEAASQAGIKGYLFPGGNLADFIAPLLPARA